MKTKDLVKGALCIALGVLLPQVFHLIGGAGPAFLPMHIPVLLAGFLISPTVGMITGIITPILSHLISGMPPIAPVPILPIMIVELAVYGLVASLLYRKLKLNVIVSLFGSMIAGRIAYGFMIYILLGLFKIQLPGPMGSPVTAVIAAITSGVLGILLQIVFIPILVKVLEGEFMNVRSNISSK